MSNIIVCGKAFPINAKVILWNEKNGLNAYDESKVITKEQDRRTGKIITKVISGKRYSSRKILSPNLSQLQSIISQFFLHHSGLYHARDTFNVLHNQRKLSVTFILDDDGTIYQTLDVKEKAWHGGECNPISVGIEIDSKAFVKTKTEYDAEHQERFKVGPRKQKLDWVQKNWVLGYEYSDQQYKSLIALAKTLSNVFPLLKNMDFPRTNNRVIKSVISKPLEHKGIICHYNTSDTKSDPISFDHERLIRGIKTGDNLSTFFDFTITQQQKMLQKLGYYNGNLDGIYGPKLKQAIQLFEEHNHLPQTGVYNDKVNYYLDLYVKGV
jgi:N-acetylmuramoyl-L-alanine amidase